MVYALKVFQKLHSKSQVMTDPPMTVYGMTSFAGKLRQYGTQMSD